MQNHKPFYERNLPHIQPENGTFFLTYRLHNSLPMCLIKELTEKYENLKRKNSNPSSRRIKRIEAAYFQRFDKYLDAQLNEPYWLKDERIAQIVADSLKYKDGKEYDLWSFTIMPNHVHGLITLKEMSPPLYTILQHHKRFTARQSNKLLGREGTFWQHESYDHLVRDAEDFMRIVNYILDNPVKAGFVKTREEWKWNYINPVLL